MTIEEFNTTRFGKGMQVEIIKTGKILDIISVDFETNDFGLRKNEDKEHESLEDLVWINCTSVKLLPQKHIVHCPNLTGKCFVCGEQAFVLEN
jgi:hypothetical protein